MIRVRNLVRTFDDFTAVKDITFDVEQGEIFAFLGPNGAGKSTTIKMLTTLLRQPAALSSSTVSTQTRTRKQHGKASVSSFRTPALTRNRAPGRTWNSTASSTPCLAKSARQRIEALLKTFELWERKDDFVRPSPAA